MRPSDFEFSGSSLFCQPSPHIQWDQGAHSQDQPAVESSHWSPSNIHFKIFCLLFRKFSSYFHFVSGVIFCRQNWRKVVRKWRHSAFSKKSWMSKPSWSKTKLPQCKAVFTWRDLNVQLYTRTKSLTFQTQWPRTVWTLQTQVCKSWLQ